MNYGTSRKTLYVWEKARHSQNSYNSKTKQYNTRHDRTSEELPEQMYQTNMELKQMKMEEHLARKTDEE